MKSWITFLLFTMASYAYCEEPINFGLRGEYRPNHPLLSTAAEHQTVVSRLTLLPIVVLKKNWVWECQLCTQVPTFQNRGLEIFNDKSGASKLAIHLELVKDAKWGDGQPVTIKDVNFTWQALRSLSGANRQNFVEIDDVVIRPKDANHFSIISRPGVNPNMLLSNFIIISQHLEAPIWEQGHQSWPLYFTNSLYVKQPLNAGLYNGPYTISAASTEKVILSAVKPDTEPSWKTLNVYFFSTYQKLFKALETAKISLVPDLTVWDSALSFLSSPPPKDVAFKTLSNDSYYYEHVDFNLQNPIFQNRNTRKALAYAIDKELIQKNLAKGWGVIAQSPVHPNYPEFSDKVTRYEFDVKKAQKILEEADWTRTAPDQTLRKRQQIFAFELMTIDDDLHVKIAQYLVQAWKNIGAQVSTKALPLSEFRARIAKRRFSGAALYAWDLHPLRNQSGLFHSTSIPTLNNHYSGQNIAGWTNSRVDPILTKMITTLDDDDRKQFWATFQHEYSEDLPGIPLLFRQRVSFVPKNFTAKELDKLAM